MHNNTSLAQSDNGEAISISRSEFHQEKFKSRYFGEGDWQGTLAMDITYDPILRVRREIEEKLYRGKPLKFLTAWEPNGEAHITTITPVEYQECMWSVKREIEVLHMKDIETIAVRNEIQSSDLVIQGLGYGEKLFADREVTDQTHFILVTSKNLLKIRHEIYKRYLENGGDENCWSPEKFYPHITVGYTHQDIHYPDVEKNLEKSLDNRFKLRVRNSGNGLTCKSVAVATALEVVNFNFGTNQFTEGYIDAAVRLGGGLEKFRVVLSEGSGYPDGFDAYEIVLEPIDNCNFNSGTNAYSGKKLSNPY